MNQYNSRATLRLFLDIILLGLSYFISVYIISLWHSIDLLRFFLDGFFAIILIKLVVILISYKQYVISNKANIVLMIVSIYNLFSFLSLFLIQYEYLYEICTLNFLIDVILISIARLLVSRLLKKGSMNKEMPRNLDNKISHNSEQIHENTIENNQIVVTSESYRKEIDMEEIPIDSFIRFHEGSLLIIANEIEDKLQDEFREQSHNGVIFDINIENESNLQQLLGESTFDFIAIYSKKLCRLDFLEILDTLKDLSIPIGILDENFFLVELVTVEDIINYFPLHLDQQLIIPDYDTLLLYTGTLCEALLEGLLAKGVDNVTIIDKYPISEVLPDKYHQVVQYIHTQIEDELGEELAKGYKRIIYGLPIIDLNYGEIEIKETIEKNILLTKWILDQIPEGKTKEFTFLSSSISNYPTTVLGGCFQNVETLIQSINKYSKVNYQVIRLPNMIKKNNKFIKEIYENTLSKESDVDSCDVFVHLCSEKEVVTLILSFIGNANSTVINIGNQVYLPKLLCDLNFRGICKEETNITFHDYAVSTELYMNRNLDYSKFVATEIPYGFILPDSDVDYLVASKVIKLLKEKVDIGTDEACKAYLGQLTREV